LPAIGLPCHDPVMSSQDAADAPVFIVTTYRSGSTLLRFLVDSHPEIACPPESRVAAACGQLALTWSSLEHAGSGRSRSQNDPVEVSDRAAVAIRAALDEALGDYLRRRGKPRWCDKSFDSHAFAEIAARVWPEARFGGCLG
jgi:protein-tyrosine sulfotransferase